MSIKQHELTEMNDLVSKGKTIADLAKSYPQYGYWEIYWAVNDYSFLGKKRALTNRLKKLVVTQDKNARKEIADEAQELLNDLYKQLKGNSAKLVEISKILSPRRAD
jgi:(p)ppGpp synthase/HD superfamily hydrolase